MTTPTHSEKLQAVKEAIVKAVPEIMEYGDMFKVHISNLDGLDRVVTVANEATMDQIKNNPRIDEYEILGRPITLEDVLASLPWIALEDMKFSIPLRKKTFRLRWKKLFCDWTLCLPLDNQPEPVIDFLYSLLPQ